MFVFGLRIRPFGQADYFTGDEKLGVGDLVLVDTENGVTAAPIASGPLTSLPGNSDIPRIIRAANPEDIDIYQKNQLLSKEAFAFCKMCIKQRKLDMKLVDVNVFFDRSKLVFYFTAPNRIDFRELVKDLVREYRARIELRQIGVRHETQRLGALGNCGLVCCCRGYLRKFAPVTIRMAKEQNLFLNPAKISGICGRLLCCLSYEQDNYDQFHKEAPRPTKRYQTDKGLVKILRINMFTNTVTIVLPNNEEIELTLAQWKALNPAHAKNEAYNEEDPDNDLDIFKDLVKD